MNVILVVHSAVATYIGRYLEGLVYVCVCVCTYMSIKRYKIYMYLYIYILMAKFIGSFLMERTSMILIGP